MPIKENGLSRQEAIRRSEQFGKNHIHIEKKFSGLHLFFNQFPTFINGILALSIFGSVLIGDYIDATFIACTVFINALIGFFQEYRAEKSLEKLQVFITPRSRVIRDGKEQEIASEDLVPDDVIVLSEGERIPADGKILFTHHIEIDESVLTGESLAVVKRAGDTAFSGTLITRGKAYVRIEKIGLQTKFGTIAKTLSTIKQDKTPLQKNLNHLGKIISAIALVIAALIIPIGVFYKEPLFPIILLATSAGIAAVPEGLPAVVTIALAIGTNRMARKKAIVRKMPVVETLGSVQVILFDKTGTITQNSMQVKHLWAPSKTYETDILKGALLGNTASLTSKADGTFGVLGDRTDAALLLWAKENQKKDILFSNGQNIVEEYTFDPETKTITTIIKEGSRFVSFVRGAPEMVLENSILTEKEKQVVTKQIETFAKEGYRVIGFGKKIEEKYHKLTRKHAESHLIFLGLLALYDPPRKEAKAAIEKASHAGIKTIMVTGDNELTALTIAKEVGMIEKTEDVVTSDTLATLSDEQLSQILTNVRIFTRATPEDKLRLVTILKKMGFVVALTGDGVNDALALKKADVGVSMGATGTDVAKEASDMIITDDNFATLVSAVSEGRTIYQNIVAAITYLFAGNLSEISFIFFAALFGLTPPFHPTQILWINIITDGLPALALASDVQNNDLLLDKPRGAKEPFLTKKRLLFISGVGLAVGIFLMITYLLLLKNTSSFTARTIVFQLLLAIHLLLVFVVRNKPPFRMNKFFFFSLLISILAQTLVISLPVFHTIFALQP